MNNKNSIQPVDPESNAGLTPKKLKSLGLLMTSFLTVLLTSCTPTPHQQEVLKQILQDPLSGVFVGVGIVAAGAGIYEIMSRVKKK